MQHRNLLRIREPRSQNLKISGSLGGRHDARSEAFAFAGYRGAVSAGEE